MTKLLHAADLHLDSPFSSLSPEQAAQRRQEQRGIVTRLVEAANLHGCDALLLAGDLFDSDNVSADTLDALDRAFSACRCPIFIAPGNHDCCRPGSAYLSGVWQENVHIFRERKISSVTLRAANLRVFGAGFASPHEDGLLEGFCAPQDGLVNVMVLHGDPQNADSPYNAVTQRQIESSGLDYLALGHIHQASGLQRAGETRYAYPGCAIGRGFDETGEKGAYLVTLDAGDCRLEFLPLGARKYERLSVDISNADTPLSAVEAALPAQTEDDIFRVILTGECEAPDLRALYAALSPRFFSLSLRDETVPLRSLWDGAEDDTLRGLYLRQLRAQYETADEADRRVIALAARLGTAAMEGREMTAW